MQRVGLASRMAAAFAVCAMLVVPLAGIIGYPHRLSVLPSLQVDAAAYDAIGVDLANRRALDAIPPVRAPGFVVFLAGIFTIFGHSWMAAKLALWLALVAVTMGAGLLARRVYDSELAGWTAALLCASSPALGWYTQTIQYEVLAAALALGLLLVATRDSGTAGEIVSGTEARASRRALRQAIGIGVIAGVAALTREVLVVLVPVLAVAAWSRLRATHSPRTAWQAASATIVAAVGVIAIWSGVQSARTGQFVPISVQGPLVVASGNNPRANGTFNNGLAGIGEPSGVAFIRAHPAQTVRLAARKMRYFWGFARDGWNVPRPTAIWIARALGGMVPIDLLLPWARGGWILVTLVVALALWSRARWQRWWPLPAVILLVMSLHALTLGSHRFAVPLLPLAFVISAGPIAAAVRAIWRRPAGRAIAAALILAAVAMQAVPSAMTYRLHAADMDGVQADTIDDDLAGGRVRTADTARGVRPVLLLTDEFLPAGGVDVRITARLDGAAAPDRAVFRLAMTALDGTRLCEHAVNAAALAPTFTTVSLPCVIDDRGPITLTVDTLAVAPLRFRDVTLTWPGQVPQ